MATAKGAFEVESEGRTLIVTPLTDLREFDYLEIEAGARKILHLLGNGTIKNVVMDFYKTDYYGSTALGFFVKLWKRVKDRNGRMAFCRVSDHEREILKATHLDGLWPICSSRKEATKAVQGPTDNGFGKPQEIEVWPQSERRPVKDKKKGQNHGRTS